METNASPNYDTREDLFLALEAAQQVPGAWEELVRRYGGGVQALVRHWGFHRDSDDLVQEIFVRVWSRIGTFRGDASLKTWIYQVAINHLRNHANRVIPKRRREKLESEWDDGDGDEHESPLQRMDDQRQTPEAAALAHDVQQLVRKALDEVPDNYREAVILKDLEELSYEEIAAMLNISPGTVKSRVSRGRAALKRLLVSRGVLR